MQPLNASFTAGNPYACISQLSCQLCRMPIRTEDFDNHFIIRRSYPFSASPSKRKHQPPQREAVTLFTAWASMHPRILGMDTNEIEGDRRDSIDYSSSSTCSSSVRPKSSDWRLSCVQNCHQVSNGLHPAYVRCLHANCCRDVNPVCRISTTHTIFADVHPSNNCIKKRGDGMKTELLETTLERFVV